ncbi:MAG: PEGA domain-containing protein [Bradymonadaceae bacterium]
MKSRSLRQAIHVALFVLALVCSGVFAAPAMGQTAAQRQAALDAVRIANEHYDAGEFVEALPLYKQAYRDLDDVRLLYRIGLTYEYLNNVVRAREYLTDYLKADPQTPYAGRIRAKIDGLNNLEDTVQSYLSVNSEPRGATVYLNGDLGTPEGTTPVIVPVGAGEHTITLVFKDRRRVEEVVAVGAGQTLEHMIHIRAGPVAEQDSEVEEPVVVEEAAEAVVAAEPVAAEPVAARPRHDVLTQVDIGPPAWLMFFSWTGMIVGDGLIGYGIYTGVKEGTGGTGFIVGGAALALTGLYFLAIRDWSRHLEDIDLTAGVGSTSDGHGVGFGFRLRY